MELAQAVDFFSLTAIDLFDGVRWHASIARVNLEADPGSVSRAHPARRYRIMRARARLSYRFQCVRFGADHVFILSKPDFDIVAGQPYEYVYRLSDAPLDASIVRYRTQRLASGVAGTAKPVVVAKTYAGYSRLGSEASTEFATLDYSRFEIEVPLAARQYIDSDAEIQLDGARFNILEYSPASGSLLIIASRRSG